MSPSAAVGYTHRLRHSRATLDDALAAARPMPYWLDSPERPAAHPPLERAIHADLVVVGAGYCGLWTALLAKERHPDRKVVVIEAREVAWAASGRNGGFCEKSLTHGIENGTRHYRDELEALGQLENENFAAIEEAIRRYGIDAEYEHTGVLVVATELHHVAGLEAAHEASADPASQFFDRSEMQQNVRSPMYLAGRFKKDGYAFVNPAKLAWGLRDACVKLGVEFYENSPVTRIRRSKGSVRLQTSRGSVIASRVALATNGFPSLLKRLRLFTVPIYDYVLVTEPLTDEQLDDISWTERFGITDSSSEFHYYRKTKDNRILFGGYDAVYHAGRRIRASHDQRTETFLRLADHFYQTFPQLKGVRFSHKWGGMIDMTTKLVAFHGVALSGRVVYSAGYTGLGVGATRFGAETMVDLIDGTPTARTRLSWVRQKPIPIPPEPFATPLIHVMKKAVQRADANGGKEGILLRIAGLLGVGFGS